MSDSESQQPARVIATFTDYSQMLSAMRARAQERRIVLGGETANGVACLPDSYLAKLLAPRPTRRIGMISMGAILQILGVRLQMIEDPQAVAWGDARLEKRKGSSLQTGAVQVTLSRRFMQKIGRLGGKNSRAKMNPAQARQLAMLGAAARSASLSPARRSQIARKAAVARWAKARAAKAA